MCLFATGVLEKAYGKTELKDIYLVQEIKLVLIFPTSFLK